MAVERKDQVFALLRQHHPQLRHFGVRRYGLFGSFVRSEQQDESDVDMLIEFDPQQKTFANYINLTFYLEALLGRKVDVVTPESLSPHIGPHILREVEYVAVSA